MTAYTITRDGFDAQSVIAANPMQAVKKIDAEIIKFLEARNQDGLRVNKIAYEFKGDGAWTINGHRFKVLVYWYRPQAPKAKPQPKITTDNLAHHMYAKSGALYG